VNEFAARGFRSLGVAQTNGKDKWQFKWQFMGIIPLYDPLREDSKSTIETAEQMGLDVKMVTGDQIAIAKEVARQLDLGTNIMDASIFDETKPHETGQMAIAIAKEVARQLNLGTNIMDASIFDETKPHETGQMADTIEQADGFAQVFPEHKYHPNTNII